MRHSLSLGNSLPNSTNTYKELAEEILKISQNEGATEAEINLSQTTGFSVQVRLGEVETVEYNRDKGLAITIYIGKKKGSASTTDFNESAIKKTVQAACHIARFTSSDPFAGLAEKKLMANNYPELDLHYPWKIDPEQAIQIATICEEKARRVDARLVNSDGTSVATHTHLHTYANSHGFTGAYETSLHSISCSLVAQDSQGMQSNGYYTLGRDFRDLENIDTVAQKAGEKTVKRLGAQRLKTCETPIIFHAEIATGLFKSFLSAISGGNIYRDSSFLINQIGEPIFSSVVNILEKPHLPKGFGSAPFDNEGVKTQDRRLVTTGVLNSYLLSSYSARKLGLKTTGNAGGAHNILVEPGLLNLTQLLKQMDKGLLVTELMGSGVNLVNGDYSRGAQGFWVEKGVIQYPVEEITIAGNLKTMFKEIIAIGNDVDPRSSILTGSILLEKMMVGGE